MKRDRILNWFVLGVVTAVMVGCTASVTPPVTPTDPPQVTVLKYTQLGATAANAAAHTLAILCVAQGTQAPVLDQGTCSQVKNYLIIATNTFQQISVEAGSSDPWAMMKIKIAMIAASATTNAAVNDPTLKAEILAVQSIVTQILGVQ